MIKIKICGITNEKEIEYLNILKPEYIGFVFAKSKRQVNGKIAKELSNNLDKEIKTVGVFKDNSIDEILEVMKEVQLDIIQLHGKEDENYINYLNENLKKSTKIWKALSIKDIENVKNYTSNNYSETNRLIDNFLIDGDNPGSGETYSLENISKYFDEYYKLINLENSNTNENNFFLAGGITPENVIERIIKANPIGIDVSSGVEIIDEKGNRTKSFEKMKSLIEEVRTINN
ncbi:phosphoribosylanthranilate isomerase [Clostridium sp.]|uniref:phosphoribosylanthranilate isomerase n=1 Tax=Clostridium sp. TaxID=1506 RepID=UPI002850CF27|nr:phosphoribosylanthranilate isomerase [Clostridium sp.]MDR3593614.1 phosphoribosylanthranilate isomerase [Clostridium sp.]